jgi:SAM-dependent methyltransferase
MPTSFRENIPLVLKEIEKINPSTVLDIGFGRGKYGFLIKEYYPNIKVDGLEVFEPYVTKLQREVYGKILIGNALELDIPQYDCYLLIDILEHWNKEDAHKLIKKLLTKGNVFCSVPRYVNEQGAEYGNEWERHISQWGGEDFDKYPHRQIHNDLSFMYTLLK